VHGRVSRAVDTVLSALGSRMNGTFPALSAV